MLGNSVVAVKQLAHEQRLLNHSETVTGLVKAVQHLINLPRVNKIIIGYILPQYHYCQFHCILYQAE